MKKRTYELIVIVLFLILCGVFLSEGLVKNVLPAAFVGEYTKPYDVPNVVLIVIAALSIGLLIKNIIGIVREKKSDTAVAEGGPADDAAAAKQRSDRLKARLTLLFIILFIIAWRFLGFYIAAPIFVFVECMILPEKEKRSVVKSLICAAATTGMCYVVFTLLFQIRFPSPLF